jgi:hypothetical protein
LQTELRETIADNLSKAGWSLGWVSAVDSQGRTIWIADAHRDGKHFIVRTDEKLSASLQLDSAIVRQNFHLFCISKLAQESRNGKWNLCGNILHEIDHVGHLLAGWPAIHLSTIFSRPHS